MNGGYEVSDNSGLYDVTESTVDGRIIATQRSSHQAAPPSFAWRASLRAADRPARFDFGGRQSPSMR